MRLLPDDYYFSKEINLYKQETMECILKISLVLLIIPAFIALFLASFFELGNFNFKSFLFLLLYVAIITIISFPLHELVHGFAMKRFTKEKVTYGYKQGTIYATTPNEYYTKNQFLFIALLPFVIVNALLLGLFFYNTGGLQLAFYLTFAIHLSGCAGDLFYAYLIYNLENSAIIQDTENGVTIYKKEQIYEK